MTLPDILKTIQVILSYPIFTVNQTVVTLTSFLMLVMVLVGFLIFSKFLINTVLRKVLSSTSLEPGLQYTLTRISHYVVVSIGAVIAFQIIGIDLSSLLVIFGFLSVGIGFGLQNVTSNFISGLILLFERPIAVGDRVVVGETEGDVEEIRMRATVVRSTNNISIIVPNSEFITSHVVNWSHADPKVRIDIKVGVAYDSDVELVMRSLHEVAKENADVLKEPKPEVLLLEFGDSSWNMELRVWITDPKRHWQVRSALHCAIVHKFRENKIEIPFPQRDLYLRSAVTLNANAE